MGIITDLLNVLEAPQQRSRAKAREDAHKQRNQDKYLPVFIKANTACYNSHEGYKHLKLKCYGHKLPNTLVWVTTLYLDGYRLPLPPTLKFVDCVIKGDYNIPLPSTLNYNRAV